MGAHQDPQFQSPNTLLLGARFPCTDRGPAATNIRRGDELPRKEAQEALKDEEPPNEELKREALELLGPKKRGVLAVGGGGGGRTPQPPPLHGFLGSAGVLSLWIEHSPRVAADSFKGLRSGRPTVRRTRRRRRPGSGHCDESRE